MDKRLHLIMLGSYVAIGLLAMIVLPLVAGGSGLVAFLIGLMIITAGGLAHEFLIRREGYTKTARAVVGLRKAFDKTVEDLDGVQKELGKASADARAANAAAKQVEDAAKAAAEQVAAIQATAGAAQEALPQLQEAQAQVSGELQQVRADGDQMRAEIQALQQQQAALQQQIQQLQAMVQQSQQMQASAPQAAPAAPLPADPPPPPPPPEPEPEPAPEPVAQEQAPAPAPAPASAPPAQGYTASVLQSLESALEAVAADNLVDNSLRAIGEAIIADNVDLYLEPIVTLPERKSAHVECYGGVRGANGSPLTIDQNLDMSGREAVMAAIENGLMMRCLDRIAGIDVSGHKNGACFYNVAGVSLADRSFFGGLLGHLQANPDLAGKLALEFPQSALMEHGEQAVEDLVQMQEAGCRFSIDEITDLEIDFESLIGFGFRFIKVGSKFIRVQAKTADDPDSVRNLPKALRMMGIDAVVEGVETDLSLVELIGFEIGYGQGPLFGQPSLLQTG